MAYIWAFLTEGQYIEYTCFLYLCEWISYKKDVFISVKEIL